MKSDLGQSTNQKLDNKGDFREFLRSELLQRCRKNPRYSLRSFGQFLQVEPSALSKILNGKRQITSKSFSKIAERLALKKEQVLFYAPESKIRRKRKITLAEAPQISRYQYLPTEVFEVLSEWYFFAILELTQVRGFKSNSAWIAKNLEITPQEARIAVDRLIKLGLLTETKEGKWVDSSESLSAYKMNFTDAAHRSLQKRILEMASAAVDDVSPIERDQSSMTMAIDSSRLPKAKEMIKNFRRELCNFLKSDGGARDRVYQLSLSLYPVSKSKRK